MTEYLKQMLQDNRPALIYIMDPMCSWCWAFRPVLADIRAAFPELGYYTLAGGLAADSDQPMPLGQQQQIALTWKRIETTVGTDFNHDFWRLCRPRRSTYPACRALLLARKEGKEDEMIRAIQHAYYLEAKNPSDVDTLSYCAHAIGMDADEFENQLAADLMKQELEQELEITHQLGVRSFPTVLLKRGSLWSEIPLDYLSSDPMVSSIRRLLKDAS